MVKMQPVPKPRELPVVLSGEEVARLIAAAPNLKSQAALSVDNGAELRASEVTSLKVIGQPDRPLTLVHNPLARTPMARQCGVWDREFVTAWETDRWVSTDILAGDAAGT